MALALGDAKSGFRYSDVLLFINEEVLSNGGGPDFYVAFRERPWDEIEDRLQAILTDPQVPFTFKRACAWSALALGVRVAARQREQRARRVRRLQEQVQEQETASRSLAFQLQRLRKERDLLVLQLRRARENLQQTLDQREVVRWQLLQAERRLQMESQAKRLSHATWPPNVQERNQVLPKRWRRRLDAGSQKVTQMATQTASATGVLYMPGFPDPQMPTGVFYPSGTCPAVGFQEGVALQCYQWSQRQEEGPVGPYFINPSGHSQSQENPTSRNRNLRDRCPVYQKKPM
ncbi:testis-expressed protein 13D-like [Phyllostomus discolor]|uniref:Testis-expressed protein 13D-like n=1 Tax=Phyllostomus discolor TaxID=89673 RepID=A0A7E6CZC7_9CHIR|nr:testis-expressed protein 13D-like [Phyllostomus discolor]